MQRTHSSNSKVMFLLKYFSTQRRKDAKKISFASLRLCVGILLAIALVASTFRSAQAQSNDEKSVQTPERALRQPAVVDVVRRHDADRSDAGLDAAID